MQDKAIDNSVRTKSIQTQYRITDFIQDTRNTIEPEERVLIKIPPPKKTKDIGINTEISFLCEDKIHFTKAHSEEYQIDQNEEYIENIKDQKNIDDDSLENHDDEKDPNFEPDICIEQSNNVPKDTKLVIFWSCLLPLLQCCMVCHQVAFIQRTVFKGSQLIVDLICKTGHETKWYSQPNIRGFAAGNVMLSASILFSGGTFQRIKELMSISKIPLMSIS